MEVPAFGMEGSVDRMEAQQCMRQKTGQCDKAGMSGWGNRSKADVVVWNRVGRV